jgi:ferredoxin
MKTKSRHYLKVLAMFFALLLGVNSCSDFAKSYQTFFISQSTCTSCKTCVPKCNYGAISRFPRVDNPDSVVIDPKKCVGCGACIKACPWNAISEKD